MRLLFPMDAQNYDPAWRVFQRDSARAILLRGGRAAMIYSRKYAYYKFPGGGIEPSEAPVQALLRETEEEAGLRILPQSIREYGCVRRIQKSDNGAAEIFRQDNFYYLCEAAEDTICQRLDAYESDEGFTLENVLTDTESEERMVEKIALRQAISGLPERERMVIQLRYFHGLTQQRVAAVMNVSQVQVSRIEKKAVAMLRELMA